MPVTTALYRRLPLSGRNHCQPSGRHAPVPPRRAGASAPSLGTVAALLFALILAFWATPAVGAPSRGGPADLCDQAVARAAARHGAPQRLLRALAKVETGRNGRPWPWTVNAGGEGRWFDSKAKALAWAQKKLSEGVKSIDLGCMQINRIWHGDAFRDLEHMLDPYANADYAARYLMSLERETGDWMRAAGFYHSRTKKHFDRYSALVASAYEALDGKPSIRPGPRRTPVAPKRPQIRPVVREAAVKEIPDEMRVALWSGLLRRPHKDLFLDLYSGRDQDLEVVQERRGGVSLAFGRSKGSLLTRAKPIDQKKRESWLSPSTAAPALR